MHKVVKWYASVGYMQALLKRNKHWKNAPNFWIRSLL